MATEYATLVFKADTKEIGQAYNQLRKLNQEGKISDSTFKALTIQTDRLGQSAKRAGGSFGLMRGGAQNLSFQLQDVAVQAQMGTDAARILAQQGPQIASAFGPAGAAAGALIAFSSILLGPFINSLFASNSAISESTKFLKDYEEGYDKLGEAQRRVLANMIEIEMEQQRQAIEKLKDTIIANNGAVRNWDGSLDSVNDQMGVTINQTEKQRQAQDEANAAIELAEQKLIMMQDRLDLVTGKRIEETDAIRQQREAAEEYVQSLQLQADVAGKSTFETIMLRAATKELNDEQMKQVENAAIRIAAVEYQEKREKELLQQKLEAERAAEKERRERQRERDAAERDLRSKGLLDAERDEYDSYQRRMAVLEDYNNRKLISEQQYNEAKANLERQAKENAINQLGEGLNALGQYNKTAFAAAKAFNIGQAIMNTYTGATKALATYPPPFNFIAAAGVVASGLAQVQSIRSQQYQGRALGGQVRSGESYVVGERGPEVLTMGTNGRIIPNEKLGGQQQVVNRTANITFEISTVDARGFDQLLQSRRGQIINMVNSAMNDQGRRGVA